MTATLERVMTTKERWKAIPGFPSYLFSSEGNVFRLPGKSGTPGGLVKIFLADGRYPRVCLCQNQVKTFMYISTLKKLVFGIDAA